MSSLIWIYIIASSTTFFQAHQVLTMELMKIKLPDIVREVRPVSITAITNE